MNEMLPILYSFRRCPYAMRARTVLNYSKINCIIREVDLKNKPEALIGISPKATVPVLHLADGKIIDQSLDIMDYALKINDPEEILNRDTATSSEIRALINYNDSEFVEYLRQYKYPDRYNVDHGTIRKYIQDTAFKKYELLLNINEYLFGKKSLADYAIMPFIRQFALVDSEYFFNNNSYKNIIRWLNSFLREKDFEPIVMAKHEPWQTGDKPVYFLT